MKNYRKHLLHLALALSLVLINFRGVIVASGPEDSEFLAEESSVEVETESSSTLDTETDETSELIDEHADEENIAEEITEEEKTLDSQESEENLLESNDMDSPFITFDKQIDDNTLYLKGFTNAGNTIRVLNQDRQELATQTNESDGSFNLFMSNVLNSDEVLTVEAWDEETLLITETLVVKEKGLHYTITDSELEMMIEVVTSPEREIILENSSGSIISQATTDTTGYGRFHITDNLNQVSPLKLLVLDDGGIARSQEVVFELDDLSISNPISLASEPTSVSNEVFEITEVSQTEDGLRISGQMNEEEAQASLLGVLLRLLGSLLNVVLGDDTEYFITVGDDSARYSIINKQFDFIVPKPYDVGTEIEINLNAEGVYRLLFLIPITRAFGPEKISSLILEVPGQRFEMNPVGISLVKQVENQEDALITKQDSRDDAEAVTQYIVDIFDNTNTQWELLAQASGPLGNENGDTLNNALFFKDGSNLLPLEQGQVSVGSKSQATNISKSIYRFAWEPDEGIVIQYNPFYSEVNTIYSTQINWTIYNGP